jgi:hypothetical protein
MNTEPLPRILPDGHGVAFTVVAHGIAVECVVTRGALERHFWLEPGANEARLLKTFQDGYVRLRAMAERKLLSQRESPLTLTAADFDHP